jgi:hypothetical protein
VADAIGCGLAGHLLSGDGGKLKHQGSFTKQAGFK